MGFADFMYDTMNDFSEMMSPVGAGQLQGQYGPDHINPNGFNDQAMSIASKGVSKAAGSGSAGLSPLGGIGIGFIGNMASKAFEMGLQTENQKSLMAYQHEMNSAQAKMRDMRSAGINPAAAAQGIAGAPASTSVAGGSAGMSAGQPGLLESLAGSTNSKLQGEFLKSQINNMNKITEGIDYDNYIKAVNSGNYDIYRKYETQKLYQEWQETKQNVSNLMQENENLKQELSNLKKNEILIEGQIGEVGAKEEMEKTQSALNRSNKELSEAKKEESQAQKDYIEGKNQRENRAIEPEYQGQVVDATNPIAKEQKQILSDFHKEYDYYYNVSTQLERDIDAYDRGDRSKFTWSQISTERHYLETLKGKLENIETKYMQRLRRLGMNESESTSILGISRSKSK